MAQHAQGSSVQSKMPPCFQRQPNPPHGQRGAEMAPSACDRLPTKGMRHETPGVLCSCTVASTLAPGACAIECFDVAIAGFLLQKTPGAPPSKEPAETGIPVKKEPLGLRHPLSIQVHANAPEARKACPCGQRGMYASPFELQKQARGAAAPGAQLLSSSPCHAVVLHNDSGHSQSDMGVFSDDGMKVRRTHTTNPLRSFRTLAMTSCTAMVLTSAPARVAHPAFETPCVPTEALRFLALCRIWTGQTSAPSGGLETLLYSARLSSPVPLVNDGRERTACVQVYKTGA